MTEESKTIKIDFGFGDIPVVTEEMMDKLKESARNPNNNRKYPIIAECDDYIPKINVMFEYVDGDIIGTKCATVKRIEKQDDGSFTVVLDHTEKW